MHILYIQAKQGILIMGCRLDKIMSQCLQNPHLHLVNKIPPTPLPLERYLKLELSWNLTQSLTVCPQKHHVVGGNSFAKSDKLFFSVVRKIN